MKVKIQIRLTLSLGFKRTVSFHVDSFKAVPNLRFWILMVLMTLFLGLRTFCPRNKLRFLAALPSGNMKRFLQLSYSYQK